VLLSRARSVVPLVSVGFAVDPITLAPRIGSLAKDLRSAQRVVIARAIKVDDIALARILQHGTIRR
jgi:hypothetical protein